MHDELAGHGFSVIAVALDEDVDKVRPLAEGISYPVLLDREHVLSDLYAISNVPSVVWIDEDDRIVRPAASEFGTDTFAEITGVYRAGHMDQVRAWVRDGEVPADADHQVADLDDDEIAARLHFRLAVHRRREGDEDGAARHFDAAAELAPLDFTIVRAAMPLRGGDPFGEEFFELYQRYNEAGRPYHGIPRTTANE